MKGYVTITNKSTRAKNYLRTQYGTNLKHKILTKLITTVLFLSVNK